MFNLVRNNSPYTVLILFIFTLVVKWQALAHPQLPVMSANHELYNGLVQIFNTVFGTSAFAYTLFAAIMLFVQALVLNAIVIRYRLFSKPTYIVAFLYLVFTSVHPSFSYFSEALILNWFLIAALNFLLGFHQTVQPRKNIYNAAFLLSMAALVHFPAAIFLLLLFITLILLRSFNMGEWVVGLMGYLTPVYFFVCILFIIDKLPSFLLWADVSMSVSGKILFPIYTATVISGLLILFACGLIVLQGQMLRTAVFTRRSWVSIIMYLLLAAIAAVGSGSLPENRWLIIMPALSLIVAHPLYLEKSKRFSNFVFYFSLLFVLICQLALNR